jgi:heterotetrameric sarcosine oxidase gamma subunit
MSSLQGESSEAVLQSTWAVPPVIIGRGAFVEPGYLYRLRRDLFFIQVPPGAEGEVLRRLMEVTQDRDETLTVTDVTHGRADLLLVGPGSPALLSRLCSLDFHWDQFPNLSAKQSSVAKSRQLILHRDLGELPAYSLVGARSLAAYLWETILEAGYDLGILPMGQTALESLQQASPLNCLFLRPLRRCRSRPECLGPPGLPGARFLRYRRDWRRWPLFDSPGCRHR